MTKLRARLASGKTTQAPGRWRLPAIALLVFALAFPSLPAPAQTTVEKEATCIGCHRPNDDTIDQARYLASVHGDLDCTTCHEEGFSSFPHDVTRSAAPDCMDCHEGAEPHDFDAIAGAVKASVHENKVELLRCTTCHSPHYFSPASRETNLLVGMGIANHYCLSCHVDSKVRDDPKLALAALAKRHETLVNPRLHLRTNPCIACHTELKGRPGTASLEGPMHNVLAAKDALTDCVACHSGDSLLATELYTHRAALERSEHGWLNSILFNTAYITGATRQIWIDWATLGLTVLLVLGVGAHAAGRWLAMRLRKLT